MTLFIATFSTLLAIINPLEALPVFLQLAARKDDQERVLLARRACLYAVGLMFFFLIFGTLILRIFGIPLSMVRIVGGIILTRLGFTLFSSRPADAATDHTTNGQPTRCRLRPSGDADHGRPWSDRDRPGHDIARQAC